MDTRVALFSMIGNADIVDYIMLWLRNMQKSTAMIARRAWRGLFLGPVRYGPLNVLGLRRTRYPLHFYGDNTEGGRTAIPSMYDDVWFNHLNRVLRVVLPGPPTFPLMETPTFPADWQSLDERKIWQHQAVGQADDGRGPGGPGGLPDSRMWGTRDGLFSAIQNPRFFGPGF